MVSVGAGTKKEILCVKLRDNEIFFLLTMNCNKILLLYNLDR